MSTPDHPETPGNPPDEQGPDKKPAKKPKGGKKPGDGTATRAEMDLRVRFVVKLLEEGNTTGEIKRKVSQTFGVKPRAAEKYFRRARDLIAQNTALSMGELRNEAYLRLMKIYRETGSDRNKLLALQGMIDLFGLKTAPPANDNPAGPATSRRDVIRELRSDPDLIEFYRQHAAGDDADTCDRDRTPTGETPEEPEDIPQ